jgi:uridine monophosphate synthetase
VSATYPEEVARVRQAVSDLWFLLPGVGAQGGDLATCLEAGLRPDGLGVVVNVSRAIYQVANPRAAALDYRDRINAIRHATKTTGAGTVSASSAAAAADQTLVDSIAVGLHSLGAVRFGEFTLKSGQKSPIYLDLRLLVSDPALMRTVARAMARLLAGLSYERIAAIPYGGLPIGQAVALETNRPLIYPRREVKEYGTKKAIEGAFTPGETVVVLDDVVKDVVVLVDRGQGGTEELAAHGYALHAVLTLGRLLDALVRRGAIDASDADGVRSELGIS